MTSPAIVFYLRMEGGAMVGFEASRTRAEALIMELPVIDGFAGMALRFLRAAYAIHHCPCGTCLMNATNLTPAQAVDAISQLREAGYVELLTKEDVN